MIASIEEAATRFKALGLHAVPSGDGSLLVAASISDADDIRLYHEVCMLIRGPRQWVAVLPSDLQACEVEGEFSELIELIERVFRHYRSAGGTLKDSTTVALKETGRMTNAALSNLPSRTPQPQRAES